MNKYEVGSFCLFSKTFINQSAMRKILLLLLVVALVVAFVTKPDDKTCIIEGVKAVWGTRTPDPYDKPAFFESFMNLTSKQVEVKDWIFFKQVKYNVKGEGKTVAFGAFKNVYPTVKPMEEKVVIPRTSRDKSN